MLAAVGLLLNIADGGVATTARPKQAPKRRAASRSKPAARRAASGGGRLRVVDGRRPRAAPPARGGARAAVPRVVIAAGGTAGHVVPALAVADALRAEGAEVSFLGTRERAEAELVPAAGYEIDFLDVRGLDRRNPLRGGGALALGAGAVPAARTVLRARGADAVLGGGGYVAGPAGAWPRSRCACRWC